MEYLVVVGKGKKGCGAYAPDLSGCIAVGKTRREVMKLIREGIAPHLESLREAGEEIPEPGSKSEVVKIRAAWSLHSASIRRMVSRGFRHVIALTYGPKTPFIGA